MYIVECAFTTYIRRRNMCERSGILFFPRCSDAHGGDESLRAGVFVCIVQFLVVLVCRVSVCVSICMYVS